MMPTQVPTQVLTFPGHRDDWTGVLQRIDGSTKYRRNGYNVHLVLLHSPEWGGTCWTDMFRHVLMYMDRETGNSRPWTNDESYKLMAYMQGELNCDVGRTTVEEGIGMTALMVKRNPLIDYLNSLEWDGQDRLTHWLSYYMGAADSQLMRAMGRAWMVSAIARALDPGCQADHCLIFEGSQGLQKSTALRTLVGPDFFSEYSAASLADKEAAILCQGVWVMEFSELGAVKANKTETVKSFITRRADHYRPLYEKHAKTIQRACVFAGSTNEETYLEDATGNRRYWPVKCKYAAVKSLGRDRDQLWAEAVTAYRAGEQWHLSKEMERVALLEQKNRMDTDVWLTDVQQFVSNKSSVSTQEILVGKFGKAPADITSWDQRRISTCLRELGWANYTTTDGKALRRWKAPEGPRRKASLDPEKANHNPDQYV